MPCSCCSGLDSASSISLVNSLRKISQHGVNIVATKNFTQIYRSSGTNEANEIRIGLKNRQIL
jgi:hypothetical protein